MPQLGENNTATAKKQPGFMKRYHSFISAASFSILLLMSLIIASCNKHSDPDPSESDLIGVWANEATGDSEDLIRTILTINEDGTMTVSSYSSMDPPEDPDYAIPMEWKATGECLQIRYKGIEQEDELDNDDYESCKYKVEGDCLLLCADEIWHLYSRIN